MGGNCCKKKRKVESQPEPPWVETSDNNHTTMTLVPQNSVVIDNTQMKHKVTDRYEEDSTMVEVVETIKVEEK